MTLRKPTGNERDRRAIRIIVCLEGSSFEQRDSHCRKISGCCNGQQSGRFAARRGRGLTFDHERHRAPPVVLRNGITDTAPTSRTCDTVFIESIVC